MMKNYVDVLVIAETKLDSSFPQQQFLLNGFKQPYRLDVTSNSGGLLVYVNDQIPSKETKSVSIPNDMQVTPTELNLRNANGYCFPSTNRPLRTSYVLSNKKKKYQNVYRTR